MSQFAWFSFFVQFLFAQVSKIWNLTTTACIVQFYICSTTRVIFCSYFLQKFCNFPCDFPPHVTIGSPSHQDCKSWQVPSLCLCQRHKPFPGFQFGISLLLLKLWLSSLSTSLRMRLAEQGVSIYWRVRGWLLWWAPWSVSVGKENPKIARIIRRQRSWSSGHLNVRVFRWRIQVRELRCCFCCLGSFGSQWNPPGPWFLFLENLQDY